MLALFVGACSNAPTAPAPVAAGTWGGDHVSMAVSSASSHLEFDCAHGDLDTALTVDSGGQFSVTGAFVREHGGPIVVGEVPDAHPANYAGMVRGNAMSLTVRLTDTGEAIGMFSLTRGAPGRVVKCL